MNPSSLAKFATRFRWVHIGVFTLITLYFALFQLPKAQMDTEMKNQLPADLPTRIKLDTIEKMFGGTDMAMIILSTDDILKPQTLERLKQLTSSMKSVPEVQRVISVFTSKDLKGQDGDMIVEDAIPSIPQTDERREALRERLKQNALVYGNLVSEDFKYAVLIGFVDPKSSDEVLVGKLEKLVQDIDGPEEAFVGGMPVTRVSLTKDMRADMRKFLPAGLALMVVFLLVCFRQARGVIMPFVVTVMAIIVAMGLVPMLGWKIYTVTILLPVILLAVANDYGIHLMARYQEDNVPGNTQTKEELAERGVIELAKPVLATGLTTMVGMLCLLSHMVIPAKQLGVLAAVGVGFAMLASLIFIPAVLTVLPKPKPVVIAKKALKEGGKSKIALLDHMLVFFARLVARSPKGILIASVLVSLGVGLGTLKVVVDTNPMSFYQQSEPIWRSTHLLNEHLGGWAGISAIVEGDIKDPKVLQEIDDFEQYLKKHPKVGTTNSIAGVMRKMHEVVNDGDPKFNKIPETRDLVAQYLLLYSMSGDPQDFEKLVDFDFKNAQVMAKVTDSGTSAATEVLAYARAYLAAHPETPVTLVGGFLDVMADMVHHIVWGQITSIAWATVLVWLVVALLMRSSVAGALSVFPLVLALAMIFGVMGFAGIELNLITALLSSIMIGVGVDYSIHFMWRYKDERSAGYDPVAAVERTLTTTGRGIVFNALSVVIGFAVLVISAFFPVRFFGLLVAISILASLIGALVVLPALCLVLRPKYFEPSEGRAAGKPTAPPGTPGTEPGAAPSTI